MPNIGTILKEEIKGLSHMPLNIGCCRAPQGCLDMARGQDVAPARSSRVVEMGYIRDRKISYSIAFADERPPLLHGRAQAYLSVPAFAQGLDIGVPR